jgi:hypothetical protein
MGVKIFGVTWFGGEMTEKQKRESPLTVRLPLPLKAEVLALAKKKNIPKNRLIRLALADYLEKAA